MTFKYVSMNMKNRLLLVILKQCIEAIIKFLFSKSMAPLSWSSVLVFKD